MASDSNLIAINSNTSKNSIPLCGNSKSVVPHLPDLYCIQVTQNLLLSIFQIYARSTLHPSSSKTVVLHLPDLHDQNLNLFLNKNCFRACIILTSLILIFLLLNVFCRSQRNWFSLGLVRRFNFSSLLRPIYTTGKDLCMERRRIRNCRCSLMISTCPFRMRMECRE